MSKHDEKRYNGWSNYQTWTVSLWLDNERATYDYWREQASQQLDETADRDDAMMKLADRLKAEVFGGSPLDQASLYNDLLTAALQEVDWLEIAKAHLDEFAEEKGDVNSAYSRAQAIEDGLLVDAGKMACEAGIKYPTALTRAVWTRYVEVPEGLPCRDEQGRLSQVTADGSRLPCRFRVC